MKYRKKPVEIEAIQWDAKNYFKSFQRLAQMANATAPFYLEGLTQNAPTGNLIIKTPEGNMRAVDGDWIIKGVKGEFYPCKPDIFAATYDPVESP